MTTKPLIRALSALLAILGVGLFAAVPTTAAPAGLGAGTGATLSASSFGTVVRARRSTTPAASRAFARSHIASKYGWGSRQFACLSVLWNRESGWRYKASNPNGRYHGIPQTSSAVWRRAGYTRSQYLHNPKVQIKVGAKYIKSRYGTPCAAWAFWRRHNWY